MEPLCLSEIHEVHSPPMKTRHPMFKPILALSALVAGAVHGQTTYTWTNALGGNIATAANWDPNGQPSGATQDNAVFDGRTAGPLTVVSTATSLPSTGFGSQGINLLFTANQVSSVTFTSAVPTGMAAYGVNNIQIDSGAGAVTFGNPNTTGYRYELFGRPAGAVHALINNSANPATLHGNVRFQAGGGAAFTLDFQGTGQWNANNYLLNDNNAGMIITVTGPGTTVWTPGGYLGNGGIDSPVTINDGRLVLAASHPKLGNQAWNINGTFQFNAPSQAQVLTGAMSGAGTNIVTAGTLTLSSGTSAFTGTTLLQGGSLVVNGAENPGVSGPLGFGGPIVFAGGTLVFSPNNTFDYSPRFLATGGQSFRFDTAGQSVTFSDPVGLSGAGSTLAKLGAGTLTLAGPSAYTGETTVGAGRLVFQGAKTGSGNITVADSAALGVTATASQVTPATLAVGTSGSATLEFNNVNSTATPLIAAGTVTAGGPITINVNGGTFSAGQSYPLLSWSSGTAPAVTLGTLIGAAGDLSTNGNTIRLNVASLALVWSGAGSGAWDTTAANNWRLNGAPAVFTDGSAVLFDDTATGEAAIVLGSPVSPSGTTVNSGTRAYSIASSGANRIGGSGALGKNGTSVLTLSGGVNAYSGPTVVNGGVLSVGVLANGGAPSDIGASASGAGNLVLNGGTLEYTGGAQTSDRLFTLGTGGGVLNQAGSGALVLNNAEPIGLAGAGARSLTLAGASTENNLLAAALGDGGGATALTKSGPGKWILTGTNTHSGVTTVSGGVLQIGNGGTSGDIGLGPVVNNGGLEFNRTDTVTVTGVVSGSGSLTNSGTGTLVLAANNTYSGTTAINAGVLQAGTGGATGQLPSGTPIVNNGTLVYHTEGLYVSSGFFATHSGTGNVRVRSGYVKAIGQNTYTGWTLIDPGATFQVTEGNTGNLLSSVVTNNGTLVFGRQDNGVWGYTNNIVGTGAVIKEVNNTQGGGDITLAGTNTYTGGTFIAGGGIILGDTLTPLAGSIVGDVIFTNSPVGDNPRFLRLHRPDDFTFTNALHSVVTGAAAGNSGRLEKSGPNAVTLTGNSTHPSGTVINEGTLEVGNGGASGAIGTGDVTDNGVLVWNRSDDVAFGGVISGTGSLVKRGAGTLTLGAVHSYTGQTIVSNGTLVMVSGVVPGELVLEGGTYVGGGLATIVTNAIVGGLTVNSGTLVATLNKSQAQPNTVYEAASFTASAGGVLRLVNAGPVPVVGDKFTLFNQPVSGGAAMAINATGFTVRNDLEVDGSVTVTAVQNQEPPTLVTSVVGSQLTLSWPAAWIGAASLQVQTNPITIGLSSNWFTIPGTGTSNTFNAPIGGDGTVFYRLIAP